MEEENSDTEDINSCDLVEEVLNDMKPREITTLLPFFKHLVKEVDKIKECESEVIDAQNEESLSTDITHVSRSIHF